MTVDNSVLNRWRSLNADLVLVTLAEYVKQDPTFRPSKDKCTTRWHASARGAEYELLINGPKFYDTRAQKGGGGAVDLAMHLFNLPFKKAVLLLKERGV